jgi:hypothetical protein
MGKVKERNFDGIWNAERVLSGCLWYSDMKGNLSYSKVSENSPYGIRKKRFYAALRAYGKIEIDDSLFSEDGFRIGDLTYGLLSKTRSQEKIDELRELLKQNLRHDFFKRDVDAPDFLNNNHDLLYTYKSLFEYRKELLSLDMKWSGVLECCKSRGMIIQATTFMFQKQIRPVCNTIDRMLILLLGDDFDKTFTEEELFQYDYPDVTDEELYQMELKEEW